MYSKLTTLLFAFLASPFAFGAADNMNAPVAANGFDITVTRQAAPERIHGQVLELRAAPLGTPPEQHVLATLRTDKDRVVVLDLGQAVNFANEYQIRKGDWVTLEAKAGSTAELPVAVSRQHGNRVSPAVRDNRAETAPSLEVENGIPVSVETFAQEEPRTLAQELTGRVLDTREFLLPGDTQVHVLAKIASDAGQIFLIDLGHPIRAAGLNLSPNARLTARGHFESIDQTNVLVAEQATNMGLPASAATACAVNPAACATCPGLILPTTQSCFTGTLPSCSSPCNPPLVLNTSSCLARAGNCSSCATNCAVDSPCSTRCTAGICDLPPIGYYCYPDMDNPHSKDFAVPSEGLWVSP